MDDANAALDRLALSHPIELHYNDEIPAAAKGRLRIEILGTPWDCDAPLFLS